MKFLATLIFSSLLVTTAVAQTSRPDTANLGDELDANDIPAREEIREEEMPNQPDIKDENATPAALEERLRQEQIEGAENVDKFEIYRSTDEIESLPAEQYPVAE